MSASRSRVQSATDSDKSIQESLALILKTKPPSQRRNEDFEDFIFWIRKQSDIFRYLTKGTSYI